jgi:hypothetical protein
MTRRLIILLFSLSPLIFSTCKEKSNVDPNPCNTIISEFDSTFGISYQTPSLFLIPGDQSSLDTVYIQEIFNSLGTIDTTLLGVRKISNWVNTHFTFVNAGGANIGKISANELYQRKEIYGCHSAALMISTVLRLYEFPALLVETASVKWAYDHKSGTSQGYVGHVMSEVYVDGHWILLDNNGTYVDNYNPLNPYISTDQSGLCDAAPFGLFVIAKGVDSWDYGVHSNEDTKIIMDIFANNVFCFEPMFYTTSYVWAP